MTYESRENGRAIGEVRYVTTRDEKIRAVRVTSSRARKQYEPGRICPFADCGATLTRYNKGPFCYSHTAIEFRPLRVRERAS